MLKTLILFLLLILPVQLFSSEIPSIKEIRERLGHKDSLQQIILEDYLDGRRELDWKTQMSWDVIIAGINHCFENDSSAFGYVLIRLGSIDSIYQIDRANFIRKRLQRKLINTGWKLTEFYIPAYLGHCHPSGYIYRWRIEPVKYENLPK